MSTRSRTRLAYDVHGLRVAVVTEAWEVAAAIERRLGRFGVEAGPTDLVVRFVEGGDGPAVPAHARPVYDTPDGTVGYVDDEALLVAELGGVRMRAQLADGRVTIAAADFRGRRRYLAAHPLMTLVLNEALRRRGLCNVHAACVSREDRGVLVAAPSGSGKSTLAVALARQGWELLGDDMSFLAPGPGGLVRALGFLDAVGVTDATCARFTELAPLAGAGRDDGFPKHLVRLEDHMALRVATATTPRVLVLPEIVGGPESRLEPISGEEAWMALMPDVLLTDREVTQAHVAALASMTAQVDCYRLLGGPDVDASARMIGELA